MNYLIIGGTGSLGKCLIKRLAKHNCINIFSRDEAKQWSIKNEYASILDSRHKFFVGDIRDKNRISDVIRQTKPDVIICAAALKQVDTCEGAVIEALNTNVLGTVNVINAILESSWKVNKCLFVSTDKASSPVNAYGMCKALSERLITSQQSDHTTWLCTRYGNVLESRGSIIPLFKYQAENKEVLTVTDPDMTRFVMTLDESVDLILNTLQSGENGETWIPKLPAMRIGDLAEIFAKFSNKKIKIIGLRPGEKKHEDLINESESTRTIDNDINFIIKPALSKVINENTFTYSSNQNVLTQDQLFETLLEYGILHKNLSEFNGLSIEEIKK